MSAAKGRPLAAAVVCDVKLTVRLSPSPLVYFSQSKAWRMKVAAKEARFRQSIMPKPLVYSEQNKAPPVTLHLPGLWSNTCVALVLHHRRRALGCSRSRTASLLAHSTV